MTHDRLPGIVSPVVSVVIPTYNRPNLVVRAVQSVLAQTLADIEIIVVVDGRDEETCRALRTVADKRLLVHVPDRHLGNAEARNEGVRLARAPLVAFLDDDDEWFRVKLERQLPVARSAPCQHPIVSCRVLVRSSAGDAVWPRRVPNPGEDLSEYFFCRRTPFTGEGMVTTTSILTTRELLLEVPFAAGLTRHEDPDWVMRAVRHGACLEFVTDRDPLVIWYMEHDRPRISTRPDWIASSNWCQSNRELFSPRGYAAFMLHVVSAAAAAQHAWRAFPLLLRCSIRHGRPTAIDIASHFANFALPAPLKRTVASWYARMANAG